ncbi:hypothetical protein [Chroococcidiopsis sp [FACHB-1243]]|nr:hypothetical protein [Chroococcidiopsis sp. [FACHB-1243]]
MRHEITQRLVVAGETKCKSLELKPITLPERDRVLFSPKVN